ncbi:MAG TPA: metallophosphoesterase [Myxococcota bacterium]|nr:metallophosphoesterase [Myxococcota bacterium]
MLVGVMADSHDNIPAIEKAVDFFNDKKVGFIIHAGDFIAPFALKPLDRVRCPWIGVFGNNDGEQAGLTGQSKGRIQPAPYELNLDGKKVVVVHDLTSVSIDKLVEQGAELIISGHTHEAEIKKTDGGTLLVNPGEIGGWLYGKKTICIVDTSNLECTLHEIESD